MMTTTNPGELCPVLGVSIQNMDVLEQAQQRALKMIKGLQHPSCAGGTVRAVAAEPREEKAQGCLITMNKNLMGEERWRQTLPSDAVAR